jgi:hypothetical protein
MKRMFTRASVAGVAAALATRLIENARAVGYRAMRLTRAFGRPKRRVVFSPGLRIIEPYHDLPQKCAMVGVHGA